MGEPKKISQDKEYKYENRHDSFSASFITWLVGHDKDLY